MPSYPSPSLRAATVTRLRAAGCVFAEDEAELLIRTAGTPARLAAMVGRRAAGEPLEQVLGWAEFCGLRIEVEPGVFVPRRRTEFLVRVAVSRAREAPRAGDGLLVVLDLCCGTGAIGAALAAELGPAEVHAADIDPAAVRCARRNLAAVGGLVYQGDLYAPLPGALRGRVGVLAANVPYVPTEQLGLLPREARAHEGRGSLDGGTDGLDVLRRVAAGAPRWLAPGGYLLLETSHGQAAAAAGAIAQAGLLPGLAHSREHDSAVVTGTRPGRPAAGAQPS